MSISKLEIFGPLTTAERDELVANSYPQPMVILNSDTGRLEFWDGAAWQGVLGNDVTVDGALTVTGDVTVVGALGISAGIVTVSADATFEERTAFNHRIVGRQITGLASANDLTLEESGTGASSYVFEITGATQINAIATALWNVGSQVTLLFAGAPTVKHNNAGGAGTAVILLAGAVDFAATAGDTLTLVYSHIGGVNAWREIGRAVI